MTEPTFHLMIPEAGRADVLLAGMIDGLTARPPNGGWRRAGWSWRAVQ